MCFLKFFQSLDFSHVDCLMCHVWIRFLTSSDFWQVQIISHPSSFVYWRAPHVRGTCQTLPTRSIWQHWGYMYSPWDLQKIIDRVGCPSKHSWLLQGSLFTVEIWLFWGQSSLNVETKETGQLVEILAKWHFFISSNLFWKRYWPWPITGVLMFWSRDTFLTLLDGILTHGPWVNIFSNASHDHGPVGIHHILKNHSEINGSFYASNISSSYIWIKNRSGFLRVIPCHSNFLDLKNHSKVPQIHQISGSCPLKFTEA